MKKNVFDTLYIQKPLGCQKQAGPTSLFFGIQAVKTSEFIERTLKNLTRNIAILECLRKSKFLPANFCRVLFHGFQIFWTKFLLMISA